MQRMLVLALFVVWLTACTQDVQFNGQLNANPGGTTSAPTPPVLGGAVEGLATGSAAAPTAAATPTLSAADRRAVEHCENEGADYAIGWNADQLIAVSVLADGQTLCQYTGKAVWIPKGPPPPLEGEPLPEPYDLVGVTVSPGGVPNLKLTGWADDGPYEPPGSRRLR